MRLSSLALCAVLLALGVRAQPNDAKAAALSWLALIDHGAYAESWAKAGSLFHSRGAATDWTGKIAAARRPLGAAVTRFLARQTAAATLPGAPGGIYEILLFNTHFARKAGAVETVVLAREPAGWKVDGYFIR